MRKSNLIPQAHKLTVDEQSAGGRASAESRKRRKALRDDLIALLESTVKNKKGEEKTTQEVVVIKLVNKAMSGDLKAINLIAKLLGEANDRHEIIVPSGAVMFGKFTDKELDEEIERLSKE